jgi:hypothetical protein
MMDNALAQTLLNRAVCPFGVGQTSSLEADKRLFFKGCDFWLHPENEPKLPSSMSQ